VTDDHRSVVLVTIDSLRADHCGYVPREPAPPVERDLTPTLDALAANGLAFENAVAPGPSTYESMPAVVTGRHMCEYPLDGADGGDTRDDDADGSADPGSELDRRNHRIAANTRRETIAEWFRERGYATGAFTTNPYTGGHTHFARGFDHYEDFLDGGEGPLMRAAARVPLLSELKHVVTLVRGDRASKPWRSYYGDVLEWVRSVDGPYFLWLFVLDPHTPYLVPDEYRRGSRAGMVYHNWRLWMAKQSDLGGAPDRDAVRRLYAGAVRSTDGLLDRLRSDLRGGDGTEPILMAHADHGEAFGEHGTYGHRPRLYEENVHVPLVIEGPGVPERSVERPVSLTAVPALLRAAAGGGLDAETAGDTGATNRPYALSRTLGPGRIALRGRDWKYIAETDPGSVAVEREELYDLASDPGEREDLAATGDHADRRRTCRRVVRRRLAHEREVADIHRTAAELAGSGRVER